MICFSCLQIVHWIFQLLWDDANLLLANSLEALGPKKPPIRFRYYQIVCPSQHYLVLTSTRRYPINRSMLNAWCGIYSITYIQQNLYHFDFQTWNWTITFRLLTKLFSQLHHLSYQWSLWLAIVMWFKSKCLLVKTVFVIPMVVVFLWARLRDVTQWIE